MLSLTEIFYESSEYLRRRRIKRSASHMEGGHSPIDFISCIRAV